MKSVIDKQKLKKTLKKDRFQELNFYQNKKKREEIEIERTKKT